MPLRRLKTGVAAGARAGVEPAPKVKVRSSAPPSSTSAFAVRSSARSVLDADAPLLAAMVGNDNARGAPPWGSVAPKAVERVELLFGAFSPAFPIAP
jgi:hypothetical protein